VPPFIYLPALTFQTLNGIVKTRSIYYTGFRENVKVLKQKSHSSNDTKSIKNKEEKEK
jgi:hypothetical protein